MKRGIFAFATAWAAGFLSAAVAQASLTASETAEVRGYVASESHADRVRALVARPDLAPDESAAAMTAALAGTTLDDRRMAFLEDLVENGPSAASRPVLAVATVRAVLNRTEALYALHPADLAQSVALGEIARAYRFVEGQVAGPGGALPDAARADIARALGNHFTHEAGVLHLDVGVPAPVAALRAQAAIALLDAMSDVPTRRVDAADRLGLAGARRAALVELGVLVVDATGADARVGEVRGLLERLGGTREGVEAVFVGDSHAMLRGRGVVVATDDAAPGPLADTASPWAPEAAPPAVEASTVAIARGLAESAVHRAVDKRPALRAPVERDGVAPVANAAAMLAVDGPRTLVVAAARSLAGKRDTLAAVADAIGVLATFAPAAPVAEGLVVPLGHGRATHVALEPTGSASGFHLDGHMWRVELDPAGAAVGLRRDGAAVAASMLPAARVAPNQAQSWKGEGIVLARLAGAPRAAISAGPRVRVVGSTVNDAVSAPAPGDDVAVDADVHVDGGPAGIVVRALPGTVGFKGVSLLVVPGAPAHAVVLVEDGAGADLAAGPVVELPAGAVQHVHIVARGPRVEANVGASKWVVSLPGDLAHGDVALRAYPGATLEATGWRVAKP